VEHYQSGYRGHHSDHRACDDHPLHEHRRAFVERRAGSELRYPDRAARDRASDRGADRAEPADQKRRRALKIDPVPFEAAENAAEATLRGAKDQLNNAANKKAALTPRIDLAKKRVDQFTQLAATGAGRRADLEQAQSDLGNLESEFLAADATESQAKAQISKSEADLINAKFDLDGTTYLAPANGRVANLALRPGVRATQFATMPVMSFIEEDDPWVLAFYHQNELRYVEPGNEAEIYMEMYPGRIIKCKVDSILWATAQGQMPISGNLPNTQAIAAPEQRIAVRLLIDGKDKSLFLAAGARGHGAIYTERVKFLHIIRKVFVRVSAKLDWFVAKLH